jgi:hypothetical protein
VRFAWFWIVLAGCGFSAHEFSSDAQPPDAPDAPVSYPACHEFSAAPTPVPAHVVGMLSGADVQSPSSCATTDAPYGIESAGPDSVVALTGLVTGDPYVVRLQSSADLAFYVVTGCSTPAGPAADQCLVFEDASIGRQEVARFVAPGPSVFVVVDYYVSHAPPDDEFVLDVYPEACTTNAQCAASTPVCVNGACAACASSFDCTAATAPVCDTAQNTCVAGVDQCLADDPAEPDDDGPAGATVLVPDSGGDAQHTNLICSAPASESDYFAIDVTTAGEVWDFSVAWTGPRDLDLELLDATGRILGLSYWEQPEHARLTYLAPGRYYALVREYASSPDPSPLTYTIGMHRATGAGCTSAADCASEYRNQVYRGDCVAGSCVELAGSGAVPAGGACDSQSDCAPGLSCPSFFFVANADTRDVCAPGCTSDTECPHGDVCTTYLTSNFCVQACSSDEQCPTAPGSPPSSPPWSRLQCQLATGRCVP